MNKNTETNMNEKLQSFPMLPTRGMVVFPSSNITIDVARDKSNQAVQRALKTGKRIFVVMQKDLSEMWPKKKDLYKWGCVASILQVLELPNANSVKLIVSVEQRAELLSITSTKLYDTAHINLYQAPKNKVEDADELEAMRRKIMDACKSFMNMVGANPTEIPFLFDDTDNLEEFTDLIAHTIPINRFEKQEILETLDLKDRMKRVLILLTKEVNITRIQQDLTAKVKSSIDKHQKEYYLREQMKIIQEELGDSESFEEEQSNYLKLLKEKNIPEEYKEKIRKEIKKLAKYPPGFPESFVVRNYLDLVFELPWGDKDVEKSDIQRARKQLDLDHYGLEDIKERILEYLAVRKMKSESDDPNFNSPIICLVGPPGVGKTSIAKSIAEALGRKYVRMSLGGMRDEAEIRGHRRTYIGAMAGRIITAIRQSKTDNPLLLFDEIDKLGSDFRGDPSSALLEALDPAQNFSFRDHYLEIPYDLSQVLFITTANSRDTIPRPLLDRMEVIYIGGYTDVEKIEIAKKHLWPKTMKTHGLTSKHVSLSKPVILKIISDYTREAGVRELERNLASMCRQIALKLQENEDIKQIKLTSQNLKDFLGVPKYWRGDVSKKDLVGIANGLAWTSVGGEILSIEINKMDGTGKIILTGRLGDVMKESASVAISYIRSISHAYDLDPDFYKKYDLHIHVPEGATPKDGPSAGITIATALLSALSGKAVDHTVAMTGEMTTRGQILPIGGLKEKLLAAHRSKIKKVFIPLDNMKDLEKVPDVIKDSLTILPIETAPDVFKVAIL